MRAEFVYRDQEPELLLDLTLPHLVYSGITFDSLRTMMNSSRLEPTVP